MTRLHRLAQRLSPAVRASRRRSTPGFHLIAAAALALWALVATAFPGSASAYPQWQLATGVARCTQCHFAPGGGGLVSNFGRDYIGDEQTTFGGDGALLHGAAHPPPWLALGGDLRGAYVAQDVQDPNGTVQAVFPMQAEAQARATVSDFSFYASLGLRARVSRPDDLVPDQNYQPISTSRLVSREHYVMWRPNALGPYVRAGRCFAPFGLRLAEHVLYVRRDLGFNQLEEPYSLSAGIVNELWEFHATAFAPDFVRHMGGRTSGLAAYVERRVRDDSGVVGAQAKLDSGDGTTRLIGGVLGKAFIAGWRTMLFAEADGVYLTTSGGDSTQFVGLAGVTGYPAKSVFLTILGERRQTDLRVSDTATNGGAFLVNWFPYAHVELEMMARLQAPSGGDTAKTLLLQLHYIL